MNSKNHDALIIRSINYKDSDKIYTIFVRDLGKISSKAKGVRKFSSKRMSSLDTLNFIRVGLYGNNEIRTITETKLIHSFSGIKSNLNKLKSAYYMIEIVNKAIYESPDSETIFDLLLKCLKRLEETNYLDTRIENYFEYQFLALSGYNLNISSCSYCSNDVDKNLQNSFNFEMNGVVCSECSSHLVNILSKQDIETFNFLDSGQKCDNLEFRKVDEILKYYISNLVGSSLKSQKFLSIP